MIADIGPGHWALGVWHLCSETLEHQGFAQDDRKMSSTIKLIEEPRAEYQIIRYFAASLRLMCLRGAECKAL